MVSGWEQGRARLLFGIWLRRCRRIGEARNQLRAAEALFESYAAMPWAERCRTELRAAGAERADPAVEAPSAAEQLTAQEQVIVELAAAGPVQPGDRREAVPLAPDGGSHLYRAFPELGVATRAQLRDALQRRQD